MSSSNLSEAELTKWDLTEEEVKKKNDRLFEELGLDKETPRKPRFEHTYLPRPVAEVVKVLSEMDLESIGPTKGICFSQPCFNECVRVAPINDGAIVWHRKSGLSLMRYVSAKLGSATNWINLHEDMASRAYGMFVDGHTEVLIRDPIYGYESGWWNGEDLCGKGPRDFASLGDFYAAVTPYYSPKDQFWTYDRWDRDQTDPEVVAVDGEWKATERCFTLFLGDQDFRVEPAGDWSGVDFAAECEKVLGVTP